MTLTDKDKLIRELRINPAGCEECEYADSKLNCTRGFQFASACESICEATEIDEVYGYKIEDIVKLAHLLQLEGLSPQEFKMALSDIEFAVQATFKWFHAERENIVKNSGDKGEQNGVD